MQKQEHDPLPSLRGPAGPDQMSAILQRSGIRLSSVQLDQLWTYHQLLRQFNPELNLTRVHNFTNMVLKLYVDSILPGQLMELPSPLMDLGTGPGMPGIPLKIAFPHLQIILAEGRQNRVAFLETACEQLGLKDLTIVSRGIAPDFEHCLSGIITRAVESIGLTLERIGGCLAPDGLAIFMKGPHCDAEIGEAVSRFSGSYRLEMDRAYKIPHTSHERRLVVFQRLDEPLWARKASAMERHFHKKIESDQNEVYKDLKKLLTSRGIRKQNKALVSGTKQVAEILKNFPERCEAWISSDAQLPPPPDSPAHVSWYQITPSLFQTLDIFGTNAPLLVIKTRKISVWDPAQGFAQGCSVLIPFQDPENVGTIIRSSVAFGASRIILLAESANPYHPKALRASGGAVLYAELFQGPALSELPEDLPLVPLSSEGKDISSFSFPESFGLLPGQEGSGLPEHWRGRAVAIPISREVESLNASTATAIALYLWSRGVGGSDRL